MTATSTNLYQALITLSKRHPMEFEIYNGILFPDVYIIDIIYIGDNEYEFITELEDILKRFFSQFHVTAKETDSGMIITARCWGLLH